MSSILHHFSSGKPDGADATKVQPSNWNEEHDFSIDHADLGSVSANQHHNQSHVLATDTALGADHSISGGVAGYVLRALSATTAKFMQLVHADLGSVGANDHHNQAHDHTSGDSSGVLTNDEHDGYEEMANIAAPSSPASGKLRLYCSGGILYWKDSSGNVYDLSAVGGAATHNILSSTHLDSTAASVVRGDVMTGQGATPKWARLAKPSPASGERHLLGFDNGDNEGAYKSVLDTTNPVSVSPTTVAAPGTQLVVARRDHAHAASNLAPADAQYAVFAADATLSAEVNISAKKFVLGTYSDSDFSAEIDRPQLANFFGDTPPSSANSMDDEFDDSSGMSGTGNGLNARWSWLNQSTSSIVYTTQGWAKFTVPAHTGHQVRGIIQTLPGDGTYDMRFSCAGFADTTIFGMWLRDGTNGDSYIAAILFNNATPPTITLRVDKMTSDTALSSNLKSVSTAFGMPNIYLRFVKSGTTFSWWYSVDGMAWIEYYTETDTVTPTQIGICMDEQDNKTNCAMYIDWFRKSA